MWNAGWNYGTNMWTGSAILPARQPATVLRELHRIPSYIPPLPRGVPWHTWCKHWARNTNGAKAHAKLTAGWVLRSTKRKAPAADTWRLCNCTSNALLWVHSGEAGTLRETCHRRDSGTLSEARNNQGRDCYILRGSAKCKARNKDTYCQHRLLNSLHSWKSHYKAQDDALKHVADGNAMLRIAIEALNPRSVLSGIANQPTHQ